MKINEVFKSIQGESSYAGFPFVFIRTAHCDLRCRWCDTSYAFHEGVERSIASLLDEVKDWGCPNVAVTGGEPLLQDEVYPLMTHLLDEGYRVLIETSGSHPIDRIDPRAIVIMDIKCPGSGMDHTVCWENIKQLKPVDEIKFVIADRSDFDWAVRVLTEYPSLKKNTLLFSPVFGNLSPREMAEWILQENLPVRLQLQLHKYIWDPERRGV